LGKKKSEGKVEFIIGKGSAETSQKGVVKRREDGRNPFGCKSEAGKSEKGGTVGALMSKKKRRYKV